ncbi:MAG: phage tail protein [Solirubrobacteraceae bacterium]
MAEPFVGEIRLFAGNFAPVGWAPCDGRLLPVSEYDTLFTLLGTTYGGDGVQNFGLPDLRGRVALSVGQAPGLSNYTLGAKGGVEDVTLTMAQYPAHTHQLRASTETAGEEAPAGNMLGAGANGFTMYDEQAPALALNQGVVAPNAGGGLPHENRQPSLCITYIIALFGIYPSQE